jgi:hypothetical protein
LGVIFWNSAALDRTAKRPPILTGFPPERIRHDRPRQQLRERADDPSAEGEAQRSKMIAPLEVPSCPGRQLGKSRREFANILLIETIATFVPDQHVLDQSLPMAEEPNTCEDNSGPHLFCTLRDFPIA